MTSGMDQEFPGSAEPTRVLDGSGTVPPVSSVTYVQNVTNLSEPLLTVDVDRLLKYREVAYLLGIPTARVYALSDAGDLPSVMLPGTRSRRWRLSDVQAYLRSLPAYPVDATPAERRRPPASRTA